MSKVDFSKIKVGDRVRVRTWTGNSKTGTVDEVSDDIKNGRPGISYQAADGGYWCYADQILEHRKVMA